MVPAKITDPKVRFGIVKLPLILTEPLIVWSLLNMLEPVVANDPVRPAIVKFFVSCEPVNVSTDDVTFVNVLHFVSLDAVYAFKDEVDTPIETNLGSEIEPV